MLLTIICSLAAIGLSPQVPDHLVNLLSQHGWGQIESDTVLDTAAQEVTHLVASTHTEVSPAELGEHLSFILAKHGISDAQVIPHMMKGEGPINWSIQAPILLKKFKRHLRPTHYGKGLSKRGHHWVSTYLFVHRGVRMSAPLPRIAATDRVIQIRGELRRGYFSPRLIIKAPPGYFGEGLLQQNTRHFNFELKLDQGPGVYAVELVAESRYGPTVLLQNNIYVDVQPPARPTMKMRPEEGERQVKEPELRLFSLINAHRVAPD